MKRTVTMKTLTDENAQLKIRLHDLEVELANWRAKSFWTRLVWLVAGAKTLVERKVAQ